jgi:AraC-like DNA-binding protein
LNKINFFIQTIADCGQFDETLRESAAKNRLESLLYQIHFMKTTNTFRSMVFDERIRDVIVYIADHLSEELTLDSVADEFALSKGHLNVLFHEIVGTPIMKYIRTKRLGFAQQEILSGCHPGEASMKAGFNDYTTFFRAYKSFYGHAPTEALVSKKELSFIE